MTEIHNFLAMVWYLLLGLILVFYVVTDGFDLGVGILSLLHKELGGRRQMMETLHGVWDANETWLVLFGGALFGAFPRVYAELLHALYVPIMIMLLGLILRGVAFEFFTGENRGWSLAFGIGSLLAALAQGLMLGAVIGGLANQAGDISYNTWTWLSPFSMVVAGGVVAGYAMLGAAYLIIKTKGPLQQSSRRWCRWAAWVSLLAAVIVTLATPLFHDYIARRWFSGTHIVYFVVLPVVALFMYRKLLVALRGKRDYSPFTWSIFIFIISFVGLAISLYPYLIPSALSIFDAASSSETLVFMLVGIGMLIPVMLVYNAYQYLALHGRFQPDEMFVE